MNINLTIMKNAILTSGLLVCAMSSFAQLNYYVSTRYDYSAGAQPTVEIGKGNITQRAALVITSAKDKGINMLSMGVSGYTDLFCLWNTIHTALYLNGNVYIVKDPFLNLKCGIAVNVPIYKSMSFQITQGVRTYDNYRGNLVVSSAALNFYFD